MRKRILPLLLALCLTLGPAAPAAAAESAAAIRLSKTTGTVKVSKSSGKSLSLLSNMRLYNGYHVTTSAKSYAWLNLDDTKLIKEDASSEVEVRKNGKKLEVNICSGNVFFDVSEKLEDDESLNISTSTMIVGIRGTAGYVEIENSGSTRVTILEGRTLCTVTDPVTGETKVETLRGGETAQCVVYPQDRPGEKCDILREELAVEDIPGFALTDVVRDMELCDRIRENTGTDVLKEVAAIVGGDPSGRSPDGQSASREVLGEADRTEARDEADSVQKQQAADLALQGQNRETSRDKVFVQASGQSSGGSGGGSGGAVPVEPAPAPTSITLTMPQSDSYVQAMLDTYNTVILQPGVAGGATSNLNTLTVSSRLSVASGKTLTLQDGVSMEVSGSLQIDGTATAQTLFNSGTIIVNSSNTLHVRNTFTNSGTIIVTAAGRVVVDGTFTPYGDYLQLTQGARVLAKNFLGSLPNGWTQSTAPDSSGYYSLLQWAAVPDPEPTPDPEPEPLYTITFEANGGSFTSTGASSLTLQTDTNGRLASWPTDYAPPVYGDGSLTFGGWYDAPSGGTEYTGTETFSADTTVYAHWAGWYIENGSTLVVVGDGSMDNYMLGIHDVPWSTYSSYINDITIGNGITSIGEWAFANCSGLTGIIIPESVTSIGESAFNGCDGLTDVTIPNSVTSIGWNAFANCDGLTEVTIPASVTSIGNYAFDRCTGLTDVNVDTENPNYSSMDGVLFNKDQTELVFYPANKSSKSSSTDYIIPTTVTSIRDSAFRNCTGLTGITIPAGVTSIGTYTFSGCTGLADVTFNAGSQLTSIGSDAFGSCDNLTKITIPSSVTSIGNGAFIGCDKLASVNIPNGVTSIEGSVFQSCTSLPDINIPSSVTSIGRSAFYECTALTKITIPSSVTSIGDSAFCRCTGLTSVTFDMGSQLTSIGNSAFDSCKGLTNITIPDRVASIEDDAFRNCTGLTDIIIPGSVTSMGDYVFRDCTGLKSATILDGATTIGVSAFLDCTGLTSVTIPASVTNIDFGAFNGCSALTGITIPAGITSIKSYAFWGCSKLSSITIPDSVTSIGHSAVRDCIGLTSITIPSGVTSIDGYAFNGCSSLKSIIFNGDAAAWSAITLGTSAFPSGIPVYDLSGKQIATTA